MTEAEMLQRLRVRYTEKAGNGDAWAFVTHVRNAAGFDANRTIDAIAMSLWPSRGLELLGFEVKCSRADWVRELRNPSKAEAFAKLVDRWFLVVADPKILHDGELPPTWGLLVAHGQGLRCVRDAPRLRPVPIDPDDMGGSVLRTRQELPDAFSRSFLAALLRAARKGSLDADALAEARQLAREEAERRSEREVTDLRDRLDRLEATVREFEREAGIRISNRSWYGDRDPAEIGRRLNLLLHGEQETLRLEERLNGIVKQAERIAADARTTIDKGTLP